MLKIGLNLWWVVVGGKSLIDHLIQQEGFAITQQDGSLITFNDGISESTIPSINLDNSNNSVMLGVIF